MTIDHRSTVFAPTVPHTGTWFLLRLLERVGFNIVVTSDMLRECRKVAVEAPAVLHAHIIPFRRDDHAMEREIQSITIREYVMKDEWLSPPGMSVLASSMKTVISMRDPVAAILTSEARAPEMRHFHLVDAFVEVVRRFHRHPNVKFLPIDLYTDRERRYALLCEVVAHCGVDPDEHAELLNAMALKWQLENHTPNNRFKEAYEAGDVGVLKMKLGVKWAEMEYLFNMGGIIMPFLGDLGYERGQLKAWQR